MPNFEGSRTGRTGLPISTHPHGVLKIRRPPRPPLPEDVGPMFPNLQGAVVWLVVLHKKTHIHVQLLGWKLVRESHEQATYQHLPDKCNNLSCRLPLYPTSVLRMFNTRRKGLCCLPTVPPLSKFLEVDHPLFGLNMVFPFRVQRPFSTSNRPVVRLNPSRSRTEIDPTFAARTLPRTRHARKERDRLGGSLEASKLVTSHNIS